MKAIRMLGIGGLDGGMLLRNDTIRGLADAVAIWTIFFSILFYVSLLFSTILLESRFYLYLYLYFFFIFNPSSYQSNNSLNHSIKSLQQSCIHPTIHPTNVSINQLYVICLVNVNLSSSSLLSISLLFSF